MHRKAGKWIIIILCCLGLTACTKSASKSENSESVNEARPAPQIEEKLISEMSPDYQKAALTNVELGLGYLSQGQVVRAKTKLTHALKLAPNISETHSAVAYFKEMVGDYKDAEREHKKAISLSSGKGAVYNNYGAFLCRRARYKEADQAFQYAVQDKDYVRTADVYENAGLCALKWPDKEASENKAIEYLTTAIHRDPNRPSALLELTALNLKQDKPSQAKALLTRYKMIAAPNARSVWLAIQVARSLQDIESLSSEVSMLKNLFKESPEYQLYLKSEKNNS
jgi:type IV pilus assembly protein PilF